MVAFDEGAALTPSSFEGFHRGIRATQFSADRQGFIERIDRDMPLQQRVSTRPVSGAGKCQVSRGRDCSRAWYAISISSVWGSKYAGALMQRSVSGNKSSGCS